MNTFECVLVIWGTGLFGFVFGIILASRSTGLDDHEQEELNYLRRWYREHPP